MVEYYMRIKDKISDLEKLIFELENLFIDDFLKYKKNLMLKAACERYFERISENIFEICKLMIKNKGVLIKDNEVETLLKLRIIDNHFKKKLKKIKGMRNIIIHQYGDVNDKLMFNSIKNELLIDTKDFIKLVKNSI